MDTLVGCPMWYKSMSGQAPLYRSRMWHGYSVCTTATHRVTTTLTYYYADKEVSSMVDKMHENHTFNVVHTNQ